LIPGEPEAKTEENRRKQGIPMATKDFEILKGLARGIYDYEIPRF
jgi:LDH2 family malate/lactate/ureidoglycolate dehydrogenase